MTMKGAPQQPPPDTDDRDPARVVTDSIDTVLRLAVTWTRWDGKPVEADDRVYAPVKSLRRVADHLVDHLAEIDARLAGVETVKDTWHGSFMTTPSDLAAFTEEDLNDARNRLERLRLMWELRLKSLTDEQLDKRVGDEWTLREVAFHVAESAYYAEAVGDLTN
ncbi:MAG: hypothetical protein ABR579_03465 [Actinomycetota bacterium]